MKHIIIESGDQLGKNTIIEGLSKYYNYDNIIIRHFSKPPITLSDNESILKFQKKCFLKEGKLIETISKLEEDPYNYYENIVIWNRSIHGEYVYSQMFRGQEPKKIENYINNFEEIYLTNNKQTYFILLTADPEFFLDQEDGKSFSKNIDQKTKELKLFDEIFDKSILTNKLKIKVNNKNKFIDKEIILNNVLNFIK